MLAIYWHASVFTQTAGFVMTCVSVSHVSLLMPGWVHWVSDHHILSRVDSGRWRESFSNDVLSVKGQGQRPRVGVKGQRSKFKVKGRRQGHMSVSKWTISQTDTGTISKNRCQGRLSRSKVKVKGQGQRPRVRVKGQRSKFKVKGQRQGQMSVSKCTILQIDAGDITLKMWPFEL